MSGTQLQTLFAHDVPLIDVRAPREFAQGAFPTAHNLPLLNDSERHQVGIRYKKAGQRAAIALGNDLVRGDLKAARIRAWCEFLIEQPHAQLYCYRGGLRSQISSEWIAAAGIRVRRVEGGYKAMRRFLLGQLERVTRTCTIYVLSGRTGSGKTRALGRFCNGLDLEGHARHRGSSFGGLSVPQPSQADFENALAIDAMKIGLGAGTRLLVEDEGRIIGRLSLPHCIFDAMRRAPTIVLEVPFKDRVEHIRDLYVHQALAGYEQRHGRRGFDAYAERLRANLAKISKRLGGVRYKRTRAIMEAAISAHRDTGDTTGHSEWIATLLREYYDPMYDYQLSRRAARVVYRGDITGVCDHLVAQGLEHRSVSRE